MLSFDKEYEKWLGENISQEKSSRRVERLKEGLGHGTVEFLRHVWFPVVKNFEHLYPEWEVRDFSNRYRYLDLAYMPGGAKGGIEIQGFGPQARDLDATRFKDLCKRQCLLALDGWTFLPIAYLSIRDEPKQCQQLVLAFIGKFISVDVDEQLTWLEAETVRFMRRLLRPITPLELAVHLRISMGHSRRILHSLVEAQILKNTSGKERIRTYGLNNPKINSLI